MDLRSSPGLNINSNTSIRSITIHKDNPEITKLMKGVEEDIVWMVESGNAIGENLQGHLRSALVNFEGSQQLPFKGFLKKQSPNTPKKYANVLILIFRFFIRAFFGQWRRQRREE